MPAYQPSVEFAHRDMGRLHVPTKQWLAAELRAGRFPEWIPHAGLGAPVLGNSVLATLHPFNLLLVVVPTAQALKAWIALSVMLAAAGAFAWARALGRSESGAAVAAIAFALSGPIVSSTDNVTYLTTYAAIPWVFAAVQWWITRVGPAQLALVGGASALCAASGDPQAWAVVVALLPAYGGAFAAPGERLRGAARGATAAAAAIVGAAPIIFPIAAWALESFRVGSLPASDAIRWNLNPARLVEVLIPGIFAGDGTDSTSLAFMYVGNRWTIQPWFASIYLGATVLSLAAFGIAGDRLVRSIALVALAFTWAALGHHAGFSQFAEHVPWLRGFRYQEKLFVWPALAVAVAAGTGVDVLLGRERARRHWRLAAIAAAALFAVALVAAIAPETSPTAKAGVAHMRQHPHEAWSDLTRNITRGGAQAGIALALLALVIAAMGRGRLGRAAPAAVGAVVALDLMAANSSAYFLFAREPDTPPPLATMIAPRAPTGVIPLGGERDSRWPERGRTENLREWGRRTLLHPWNLPLGIRTNEAYLGLRDARWERLGDAVRGRESALALFGFDHLIVADTPTAAAKAGVNPPWDVVAADWELPAFAIAIPARPRAYVAPFVASVDEASSFHFAAMGGVPDVAVVEGPSEPRAARANGAANIEVDLPDEVHVLAIVLSDRPALLVLNDLFAAGWRASVDGIPATIHRANFAARGVWVPPGRHRVKFEYRTPGLGVGVGVALTGVVVIVLWEVMRRRRARR